MAASERKSGLFITKGLHALRIVFMMGHADSDMYDGLFRTCRTGRDWVLTTAKMVCVKLELSTEQLFAKTWKCQIPAAKRALTIRGRPRTGFTTVLSVYGYNGAHFIKKPDGYGSTWFASQRTESAAVNSLVSFMQRYGHYVNELWLGSYGFDQPHFMLTLLQRAASGLSNVATITMQECACILPPPSQLPSLQQLSTETLASDDNWAYGNMEHEFRSSIAAVLPQLTTLSAYTDDCDDGPVLAAVVRRSGALCAHLTELVAPRVDDSLVCALIDHCPNLRRLETYSLNVSQQHKGRVWGVQALAVYSSYYNADVYNEADAFPYDLTRLARLPRLAAGSGQRLRMVAPEAIEAWRPSKGRLILTVEDATGMDPAVAERLHEWSFSVAEVMIESYVDNPFANTLRALLTQLRALDAPGAMVSFKDWQWSQALADVLTEALPSLSHLNITVPEVTDNAEDVLSQVTVPPPDWEYELYDGVDSGMAGPGIGPGS